MLQILKAAATVLVSAANGLMLALRKGAELSEPFHVEFRCYPDGWR